MMIIVNRSEKAITGSYNGKQFGVRFDQQKYDLMKVLEAEANEAETYEQLKHILEQFEPLTEESYKDVVETMSPYIVGNPHNNKFYLRYNDVVSAEPFPKVFADKLLKSVEKNIDITPLIKCWARFMRPVKGRPRYTEQRGSAFAEYLSTTFTNDQMVAELQAKKGLSYDVAVERSTTLQVAITQEGLLNVYKVSREITKKFIKDEEAEGGVKKVDRYDYEVDDITGLKTYKEPEFAEDRVFEPPCMGQGGDAFACKTLGGEGYDAAHVIKVGHVIELDSWDKVNCDMGRTGAPGLHVGGLRYIAGWQNSGTVTHNIFVDPMDIGAIVGVGLGNDGAMRVRRYYVHSSFVGPNKTIYHSSKFAALTDEEYAKLVQEAVEDNQMKKAELDQLLEAGNSLAKI